MNAKDQQEVVALKVVLRVIDYNPQRGIELTWEEGCRLKCRIDDQPVSAHELDEFWAKAEEHGFRRLQSTTGHLSATLIGNKAGLTSMANHLVTLAQNGVPDGARIELDDKHGLLPDSCKIVIVKKDQSIL